MKRYAAFALCALLIYLVILGPFTRSLAQKPYAERLGLIPQPKVLQVLLPDYQQFLGAGILTRVILYYGDQSQDVFRSGKIQVPVDYPAMSRAVHAALRLDPYNMDGYYFAQSILVWDVHQYRLATDLLEYGMKYRTWDWYLPFFAGFNYAYFLKDPENAAKMYMRAGELSGESLFKSLAGRYLQEAGETRMAIDYLQTLEATARTPSVRKALQVRIKAFKNVVLIEQARDRFIAQYGKRPSNIVELVNSGMLVSVPPDPYGGRFYLGKDAQVKTTSKFAPAGGHSAPSEIISNHSESGE